LHGERGTITVDDDQVKILASKPNSNGVAEIVPNVMPSHWMDASHREWFGSLLEDFRGAIETDRWVSSDTIDSVMCMATIETAYNSAQQESRELAIRDASSLTKHAEVERNYRSSPMILSDCASRP